MLEIVSRWFVYFLICSMILAATFRSINARLQHHEWMPFGNTLASIFFVVLATSLVGMLISLFLWFCWVCYFVYENPVLSAATIIIIIAFASYRHFGPAR